MKHKLSLLAASLALLGCAARGQADNEVMLQGFYWDLPVDAANKNGDWWNKLAAQAPELAAAGITGIWTPSPAKGNWGIHDMGYGIFDHYDLGDYAQKGSVETRFGSRAELKAMVEAMHGQGIAVYADVVLNHVYAGAEEEEANPEVKRYVFDEARRDPDGDGVFNQYQPYPTNEIRWRIPAAAPGDYYVKIKGFHLDCAADYQARAYDLAINWDGAADTPNAAGAATWESEPNGGNGASTPFPGSGRHVWAHANTCGDVDEYKFTLSANHDIELRLEARRETRDAQGRAILAWADQGQAYYPVEIWHQGQNLAATVLEARTSTAVRTVAHRDAPSIAWDHRHFHPVDARDYLGAAGSDELIPNTKFFGNDLNTFDPVIATRLQDWGRWLTATVGYDGYRLDFVRGFQAGFAADWIKAMPRAADGSQRFVVAEYWGGAARIADWVRTLAAQGAGSAAFDFPLKTTLTAMANGDGGFDMRALDRAGLVRNAAGHALAPASVVSFVDNHDTGKEHDKWLRKDWALAYAYILFAQGRPTIFYPHFYGIAQTDAGDATISVQAPAALRAQLEQLIALRKHHLGGAMAVLSETGNPWPAEDARHVHIARRQGQGVKTGAILVLNNHDSAAKGLWVDHRPGSAYADWAGKTLVDIRTGATVQVQADGRVYLAAPARGYALWLPQEELAR